MGCLQGRGRGRAHLRVSSCTVTAAVSIPPLSVSKLVFVAGEERHGRGSAALHQEPQTRPRSEGTECTQTASHTLVAWGGPWGRLGNCHTTLFESPVPSNRPGIPQHSDNGMSQGAKIKLKDLLPKGLPGLRIPLI